MNKIQNCFPILENKKIPPRYYKLSIDAKKIIKKVKPGQFLHIRVHEGLEPFFRRPFSVHRAKTGLEIFYEVVGPGTAILAQKKKGEALDILGPLGNAFAMPPSGIKQVVMIAGGIGVAPFLILSDFLKDEKYEKLLLYGGRSKAHTFSMQAFRQNGCRVFTATDDGSVGVKGRVSKLFSKINPDPQSTYIYTCGPALMMRRVQEFAKQHQLRGQASCEEVMACGLGACLGCVIKTSRGNKSVCYDGPVFDLQEVIF